MPFIVEDIYNKAVLGVKAVSNISKRLRRENEGGMNVEMLLKNLANKEEKYLSLIKFMQKKYERVTEKQLAQYHGISEVEAQIIHLKQHGNLSTPEEKEQKERESLEVERDFLLTQLITTALNQGNLTAAVQQDKVQITVNQSDAAITGTLDQLGKILKCDCQKNTNRKEGIDRYKSSCEFSN